MKSGLKKKNDCLENIGIKLNKTENKKTKKPLKLSSAGRLQIRRNLGPTGKQRGDLGPDGSQ